MTPPLFSFYGDDFTGSTDALEALAEGGFDPVLFLKTPQNDDLRAFSACKAIGIAGNSRSQTPDWMRAELPAVFMRLREIGAPVVQYKFCSTFDSSPEVGSIGCAIEVGKRIFGTHPVPVVPAAPLLGRYVAFGNLFASDGHGIHRVDRHPAMMNHPVTPMDEGDLALVLARQMQGTVETVNLLDLRRGSRMPADADAVVFDGLDTADLASAARIIWDARGDGPVFVAGSSGFTYGLLQCWRELGLLDTTAPRASATPVDRLLVLAGSCSPATGRQICHALRAGFRGIRIDPMRPDLVAAKAEAVRALGEARSVILYSAIGPEDRVEIDDRHAFSGQNGALLRDILLESSVKRAVIAGGDTSSHAVEQLGIPALTFAAPLARGAPLCRAHGWPRDLELVLKGGQVGSEDFFEKVMSGT